MRPLNYEIINFGSNKLYRLDESIKIMEECIGRKGKCNYKKFDKSDEKATWTDIEKEKRLLEGINERQYLFS